MRTRDTCTSTVAAGESILNMQITGGQSLTRRFVRTIKGKNSLSIAEIRVFVLYYRFKQASITICNTAICAQPFTLVMYVFNFCLDLATTIISIAWMVKPTIRLLLSVIASSSALYPSTTNTLMIHALVTTNIWK